MQGQAPKRQESAEVILEVSEPVPSDYTRGSMGSRSHLAVVHDKPGWHRELSDMRRAVGWSEVVGTTCQGKPQLLFVLVVEVFQVMGLFESKRRSLSVRDGRDRRRIQWQGIEDETKH